MRIAMIAVLLLSGILQGCASFVAAPYPERMLQEADNHIESVELVSLDTLAEVCGRGISPQMRAYGCAVFATNTIYVYENHWNMRCAIDHERSHFYDVYVKGRSINETYFHQDWLTAQC